MWEADPATLVTLILLIGLYAAGTLALKRRPTGRQFLAYTAGVIGVALALTGPLDQLTKERSFAVYIFQQMVLVFVVPPLLLAGTPDWMVRPFLLNRYIEPLARFVTRPLVAYILFGATFTLVHFPLVCDRVCHVHPFYGDVHTVLLVTGLVLWFPLLSPLPEYPRLPYAMQIMYVFLLMIPMTAVAAPITMAQSVLYTFYVEGPHPLGLTPMADQVLGGLIMWIGQGIYLMFVFSAIFFRWARRDDLEIPPFNRRLSAAPPQVLRPQRRNF
jgi:putative membrane protein